MIEGMKSTFGELRGPPRHASHSHKVVVATESIHPVHQCVHGLYPGNGRRYHDWTSEHRVAKHWVAEEGVVHRGLRRILEVR